MKDDFAHLAVLDAYRWWIASDFGFLQLTGVLDQDGNDGLEIGRFDKDAMRRIARAYTVSRNIPSHQGDAQASTLAALLSGTELAPALRLPFAERAVALSDFVHANPGKVAAKDNGQPADTKIASAITKLTWFLQPDDWTIFDKYVGVAVLRREGTGPVQMAAYYSRLADDWGKISAGLCDACAVHGFNTRLGYRIVDKYLFLHGIGMYVSGSRKNGEPRDVLDKKSQLADRVASASVAPIRESLRSFAKALPADLSAKLTQLGQDAASLLAAANWIKDPA